MRIYFLLLLSLGLNKAFSQPFIPGQTYYGANDYIEYRAGNIPIIISAPHGGDLEPAEIPDRNCTGCVTTKDLNTDDLAGKIYDEIFAVFGCYPHVIINRLHRKKLDANRAIVEAANGNALAEEAWNDFHFFIESAKDSSTAFFGKGLYIDLHGHGHSIQRLEMGYRLTKSQLQSSNNALDQLFDDASIKNLSLNNLTNASLSTLIRGNNSLGELFEDELFPSVPSKTDPYPENNDSYFRGGYNTERHGSINGGTIDGIQIECNKDGVRDTDANRQTFAEATARVIKKYLEMHYFGIDFLNQNCNLATSTESLQPDYIQWEVYPNPSKELITLDFSDLSPFHFPIEMNIINLQGKSVKKIIIQKTGESVINVSDLNSGFYYLQVFTSISTQNPSSSLKLKPRVLGILK